MVYIGMLGLFSLVAAAVAAVINQEALVFAEFRQPRTLAGLVWLYPLGPTVGFNGIAWVGPAFSLALAALCFVPATIAARRLIAAFERAGTDRVDRALGAANLAMIGAIGGYSCVVVGAAIWTASIMY